MNDRVESQIFVGFPIFPFVFRVGVGFFVGLVPGAVFFGRGSDERSMVIRRIGEPEFMFLRGIGIPEVDVI